MSNKKAAYQDSFLIRCISRKKRNGERYLKPDAWILGLRFFLKSIINRKKAFHNPREHERIGEKWQTTEYMMLNLGQDF